MALLGYEAYERGTDGDKVGRLIDADVYLEKIRKKIAECSDLLDESASDKEREDWAYFYSAFTEARIALEKTPTADAEIIRHGFWDSNNQCSCCGEKCVCDHEENFDYDWDENPVYFGLREIPIKTEYCPYCGAKMDKEHSYE